MKYRKKSFGKNLLNKLNEFGYGFRKWKISQCVYSEFLNIIEKLGYSKNMFENMFAEYENMWSDLIIDKNIEWDNGLPINKIQIPKFNIDEICKSKFCYYWIDYIEYGIQINKKFRERGIAFIQLNDDKLFCSKYFYYQNKLILNGTFFYNLKKNLTPIWEDYTYMAYPFEISPIVSYHDQKHFKNNFSHGYIPIYPDIRKKCVDLYSMRYNLIRDLKYKIGSKIYDE